MSSLKHDVAWTITQHVLEVFAPLLREEEKHEAFAEIFARVQAGIECLEIKSERMRQRLNTTSIN